MSRAVEAGVLVSAHKVLVRRGARIILQDVDLQVRSAEIITVIGPNGAGKTSLIRALLGLMPIDGGEIRRREDLRIGYMPQRILIDPVLPLTVRRFLSLSGALKPAHLDAVLRETNAAHLLDQPVQAISGGEMQRVLLARALLREPQLLVLDEPAQGVDVTGQGELYALLARIRERHGCGILLVSHDLHLVMEASDSVLCLNQHVCCTGHPQAVSRHPEYLRLFGPVESQGLAVYTHHHDHSHDLHGDVVPLDEPASGQAKEHDGHG